MKQLLTSKRFVKVITPGENNLYAKDNYKSKIYGGKYEKTIFLITQK